MTAKIWTATSVVMDTLHLHPPEGGSILVERGYIFSNASGILNDVGGRGFSEHVPISSIPAGILQSLQQIDNWTHQRILAKENMT